MKTKRKLFRGTNRMELNEHLRYKIEQEGHWQAALLTPAERIELKQYLHELEEENRISREHLRRVDIDIAEIKETLKQLGSK